MAFRGYELNLMLRVQDRATTRIRRLSQDLGGVNRAAQIQRDAARLARQATTQNALLEQRLAFDRLTGLQKSASAASILQDNLNAATAAGRLTANQASQIADQYARTARQAKLMTASRVAIHAGGVAAMFGGLGVGIAAGASNTFANFNRESVKAATQMRGVGESFRSTNNVAKILQNQIYDLTRQFPASAAEMAQSAYEIASGMDFAGNSIRRYNSTTKLLKVANNIAVAGFVDLQTATSAMIVTLNNFDPQLKNVNSVINTLFATVRFGRGDFATFAPLIGRMAATANAAGQTLEEAGGAVAFLSQRLKQTEAVTAYIRILQILGRKEFTTGFQKLFNVSPFKEGTRQLKDLSDLIFIIKTQGPKLWPGFAKGSVDLMNVIQNITAAGQNALKGTTDAVGLVSTQQARTAMTNLLIGWDEYSHAIINVTTNQNEFNEALKAGRQAPGVRWQIAINQFKAFAIIFGESVLPKIMDIFTWLGKLIHRFEDLSPRTRNLIGSFFVWGSAITLVSGLVTMLVGSVGLLIARFGFLATLLGFGAGGLTGRATKLAGVLRGLVGIGVITIGIKLLKLGDNDLWSTLLGGGLQVGGAAFLGSRLAGAPGAVIAGAFAAYSIPLQMAQQEMQRLGVVSKKTIETELKRIALFQSEVSKIQGRRVGLQQGEKARTILIRAVYMQEGLEGIKNTEQYMKTTLTTMQQDILNYARTTGVSHMFYQGHKEALRNLERETKKTAETMAQHFKDLAAQLTGIDVFNSLSRQAVTAALHMELNLAKAEASGNKAGIAKALNQRRTFLKTEIARMEKLPENAERVENLVKAYDALGETQSRLANLYEKTTKAETALETIQTARVRALQQAKETQFNAIEQGANNLLTKYKELETANKAAFSIFEGPISRGPIAQMYNQINDMLMGFGQRPIAIPIQLQIQDMQAQVANFERFQADLDMLRRKGAPKELIQELQGKGVEALPLLEGLAKGSKGAFSAYVRLWKQGQNDVNKATQRDMNRTLALWRSYGQDIAWQIIQGLASDKAQAKLLAGYKKWIVGSLGKALKEDLDKQVQKAVAEWMATHRKTIETTQGTKPAKPLKPSKPKPASGTTRAPANVTHNYHGDTVTINADAATAPGLTKAINKYAFTTRNRR